MSKVDPFPDDEPLFTITAANAAEHAEHLSPGQQALLARYPDTWRMHVYPSRRSAAFPEFVHEALAANAETAAVITTGRGGVSGSLVKACGRWKAVCGTAPAVSATGFT